MNVLSVFDGMSCGQIALEKAGVKIDKYFASEIEIPAIRVTQANYPDTIQLGDITKIRKKQLPKIYLLIGGSPCQGFSFAGKQLNFDDPRSVLFFEYVRLLKELKPKYFLLENVKMKKEHQDIISENLGCEPVLINSSLVSAHDRKRLYWTNIPMSVLPENKSIFLEDVLDYNNIDDWYFLAEDKNRRFAAKDYKLDRDKSCVLGTISPYQGDRVFDIKGKGSSLSAAGGNNGGGSCNLIMTPRNKLRKLTPLECERLQTVPEGYTSTVSRAQRYKMLGNGWTVDVISYIFKGINVQ